MNSRTALKLAALLFTGATAQLPAQTNLLVALDGSAQFKSVQAAIMSVPAGFAANPVVIRIKPGVYKESIYVQREKRARHLTEAAAGELTAAKILRGTDGWMP